MRNNTHKSRLLNYLREFGKVTTLDAFRDLGNTDLAGTVRDLRKEGFEIYSNFITVSTRFTNSNGSAKTTEVSEYTLVN